MAAFRVVGKGIDASHDPSIHHDFIAIGQGLAAITAGDLTELRSMSNPPQKVKIAFEALLMVLGEDNTSWVAALHYLRSASSASLAAKLRSYEPSTLTPNMLRKLKPLAEQCPPESVNPASRSGVAISSWVAAVYAYGAHYEERLSNYAVLAPHLAQLPYSKLSSKYMPASGYKELGFCWRTGVSESDHPAAESVELA